MNRSPLAQQLANQSDKIKQQVAGAEKSTRQRITKQIKGKKLGISKEQKKLELVTVIEAPPKTMSELRKEKQEAFAAEQAKAKAYADAKRKTQQEHEKKRRQELLITMKKQQEEDKQKELEENARMEKIAEDKARRVEELMSKKAARQAELEARFSLAPHQREGKPLFLELEERFLKGEIDKDKFVKNSVFSQFAVIASQQDEMADHIKRYNKTLKENESRREKNAQLSLNQPTPKVYKSEYYQTTAAPPEASKGKTEIRNRQTKYASVVRESHRPVADPLKQLELAHIKNKLSHPSVPKVYTEKVAFKPRRRIKSSVDVDDRPIKLDKSVDFLADQRNRREKLAQEGIYPHKLKSKVLYDDLESMGTSTDKMMAVKNRSDKVDRTIQLKQKMLNSSAPISAEALELSEEVNGALLGSIQAKLKVLNEP